MKNLVVLLSLFFAPFVFAQPMQNVRGKVIEKETENEVIGAQVSLLLDNQTKYTAITNENGEFVITKVVVGKYVLKVVGPSFIAATQTVTVNSGTESVVEVTRFHPWLDRPSNRNRNTTSSIPSEKLDRTCDCDRPRIEASALEKRSTALRCGRRHIGPEPRHRSTPLRWWSSCSD